MNEQQFIAVINDLTGQLNRIKNELAAIQKEQKEMSLGVSFLVKRAKEEERNSNSKIRRPSSI